MGDRYKARFLGTDFILRKWQSSDDCGGGLIDLLCYKVVLRAYIKISGESGTGQWDY